MPDHEQGGFGIVIQHPGPGLTLSDRLARKKYDLDMTSRKVSSGVPGKACSWGRLKTMFNARVLTGRFREGMGVCVYNVHIP